MSTFICDVKDPMNYTMILEKLDILNQIQEHLRFAKEISYLIDPIQQKIQSKISGK